MTRILRFLLIAAVAWPLWQPAAAQEPINELELKKLLQHEGEAKVSVLNDNVKVENKDNQNGLKDDFKVVQILKSQNAPKRVAVRATSKSQIICDGTNFSVYFPVYGSYFDYGTSSQMIYPASLLSELKPGDQITSLTFYAYGSLNSNDQITSENISTDLNHANVTLKIGETTSSTIANETAMNTNRGTCTLVFDGSLNVSGSSSELTITFSEPYTWNGGNLIVDFVVGQSSTGSDYYERTGWYGLNNYTNASLCVYKNSYGATSNTTVNSRNFLPKMKIDYIHSVPYEATIDGNGDFGKVVVNQTSNAYFTVTNTGENAFTPIVAITNDQYQVFTLNNGGNGELEPKESRYYMVTFAPTALQNYSATLTLTAQESEASAINYTKQLSGVGSQTAELGAGVGDDEEILPLYLAYLNYSNHGQIIYPANELKLTKGTVINKITFHANNPLVRQNYSTSNPGQSGTVTLKIGETDQSVYTSASSSSFLSTTNFASTSLTNIYTGTTEVTFTFSTPYTYNGGNLVIDAQSSGGNATASSVQWLGNNTSSYVGLIRILNDQNIYRVPFLPWITIDCVPAQVEERDITVLDPGAWKNFTYDWYENGDTGNLKHTSSLDSIARDPDQIIAMLKEVYTNKNIPGNIKRGFAENGADDHNNEVLYTGVGTLAKNSSGTVIWNDSYGWGEDLKGTVINDPSNSNFWYMKKDEFRPNEEGLTLLLLEMVDDFNPKTQNIAKSTSNYAELRDYFSRAVKSARIIKDAKRTGDGMGAGTLFKIDCDKMNKFYLIAKGQLMWAKQRYVYENGLYSFTDDPAYVDATYTLNNSTTGTSAEVDIDQYFDWELNYDDYLGTCAFLCHMFEQFSPSISSSGSEDAKARDDIYQDLINMESFGVIHDCPNVPYIGHHFMMYGSGEDGQEIADAQDVRDMMFFVPDYRMMKWTDRGQGDGSFFDYFRYNAFKQPTMGLYVIRQNEITTTVEEEEYYMLNLNWVTNLDDFLPSDQQEFELLEVVLDEATGVESYVPVYYMNTNGQYINGPEGSVIQGHLDEDGNMVYTDDNGKDLRVPIVLTMNPGKEKNYPNVYVKREDASKEVTYIIRGRDVTIVDGERKHFLSLQYSNKMSYIVPGTDPSELVLLADATHYSRFDAERVRNAYSNKLEMNNNVDGMKQNNLNSGSQMTITRTAQVPTGSTAGVSTDPVTIATVTFNPSAMTYTVQMAGQADDEEDFPLCSDEESRAGYHANSGDEITNDGKGNCSWKGSYTVNNGNIELGSLVIFDNFVQAIPDDNSHPFGYIYNVTTNYPCVSNAVFLNAADYTNGDEIWSAYTWTSENNAWIDGVDLGNGLFKFSPVKPGSNVLFARKDKNNTNTIWNQTADLTFGTNDTYTITGWDNGQNGKMGGYWEQTNNATAHGNTFRIPVYKTSSQINGIFSQTDVDNDKAGVVGKIKINGADADLPENVEFGVGVSHNSKTEVLRYDTYRWPEGESRYTVQTADGDDEEDIAPSGQAMNQGESYTITMNGDTPYEENGEVSVAGGTSNIATFVDKYPGLGDNAGAYIYAPIVEAFSGRGERDYNTYGGPLQSSASGRFDGQRDTDEAPMSSYYWEDGGKRYAYYTIQFSVDRNVKMVPEGYDIYKIRVWRKIDDKNLLKEEYATQSPQIAARMGDENGTYMYEISYDEEDGQVMANFEGGASLGSIEMKELIAPVTGANGTPSNIKYALGTFGAQKLRTTETEAADLAKVIEQLDLTYVVRLYFTRSANLSSAKGAAEGADGKYYIVEQEIPVTLKGGIPTAVENITSREVVGVKYYNVAGIESDKPFQGVNIVVTRYSDGSTTTTKILK